MCLELLTSYEVEILNGGLSDWSMMKNKRLLGLAGDEAIQVRNLSLFFLFAFFNILDLLQPWTLILGIQVI